MLFLINFWNNIEVSAIYKNITSTQVRGNIENDLHLFVFKSTQPTQTILVSRLLAASDAFVWMNVYTTKCYKENSENISFIEQPFSSGMFESFHEKGEHKIERLVDLPTILFRL